MKQQPCELKISFSRGMALLTLVLMGLFLAGCIWFSLCPFTPKGPPLWLRIFALVFLVPYFGGEAFLSVRGLFSRKPGLIVDRAGIVNNTAILFAGLCIPWEDVTKIKAYQSGGHGIHTLYAIHVRNPQAYIRKAPPPLRLLAWLNWKCNGSPLIIEPILLKTVPQLEERLQVQFADWKRENDE